MSASEPLNPGAPNSENLPAMGPVEIQATMPQMAVHQVATVMHQQWSGSFPPPEICEHYERLLPGSFATIVRMAEQGQNAHYASVTQNNTFRFRDNARGQWLGASVCSLAIVGCVVCAITGHDWVAGALVGVPVLGVAMALVKSGLGRTVMPKS